MEIMKTLTELMAARCDHCPICRYARANPDTLVGKVMSFHGKFCPFWRAWEKTYGSRAEQTSPKTP